MTIRSSKAGKLFRFKTKTKDITMNMCREFDLNGERLQCKVLKVYDGDTVTLGFKYSSKIYKKSCRLHGIDTPELRGSSPEEKSAAEKARDYLKSLIMDEVVIVDFLKNDKYGRPLVNIFIIRPRFWKFGKKLVSVNDLMLVEHANDYDGGKKKEFNFFEEPIE